MSFLSEKVCTVVDMIKQSRRTEHADFSLKRGTPMAMTEKFGINTQENAMYYNGKVLLVNSFKKFIR